MNAKRPLIGLSVIFEPSYSSSLDTETSIDSLSSDARSIHGLHVRLAK